jgi:hypothetical protein
MSRLPLILLVAAACGGSSKPPPTVPLPDDTQAVAPPPAPTPAPVVETPPPAPTPVEVKVAAAQTTVKLISGGRGKKQPLRYTPTAGAKQSVELSMDFTGKQDAEERVVPTIVLTAEAEAKAVDPDGNVDYTLTVTGTDARSVEGSSVPVDQFKGVLGTLSGLTIGGKRDANGLTGEQTMRIENPAKNAAEALELIRLTLPALPVLPKEPVGVGAKWQSTTTARLADQLDIAQVTDYELVAHKGTTWTIKGKTKVTGKDQTIDNGNGKISAISGAGTSETTIADGALYPTHKGSVETQFKALAQDKSIQFKLKVGGAVTPKAP